VITALLDGLQRKLSDAKIADLLNARGVPTATGAQWTAVTVKNALYSLRHAQIRSTRLHRALLEFVFAGILSVGDAWTLLQPRPLRGAL
jgi:hypothetical protein